mmetsp:Transcript_27249/g.67982  ORF Transcript_27249/g.67982 Transcript_27249/m.67982 type:complete len:90 (-) Transcript_27249:721-990(-)
MNRQTKQERSADGAVLPASLLTNGVAKLPSALWLDERLAHLPARLLAALTNATHAHAAPQMTYQPTQHSSAQPTPPSPIFPSTHKKKKK